jgi:histidine triad (HIT) family protein
VALYEDDLTLALMDIMPSVEGHTLVITKEPAEGILDLSPEGAAALIRTTQKVARAVKKGLGCPGVMLVQLNGAAAGQSIPHIHFHILPREAGLDLALHGRAMQKPEVLEAVAARIRAAL